MGFARLVSLLPPALVGWGLCGATIAIGRAITSLRNALIAHAIATPIVFAAAPAAYFRGGAFTTPLQPATVYTALVIVLDLVVVATFIEKSYAMFKSVLGTWLPFALIFASTFVVGADIVR